MRIYLGLGMRKAASFINSLIPAVLKPDDIIKINQIRYSQAVDTWSNSKVANYGLCDAEVGLLNQARIEPGSRILVLFAGGGRETIALAKQGHQAVGVDVVPGMIAKACKMAKELGVKAEFYVQDVTSLSFPAESFDAVVAFARMYGSVPTVKRRIGALKKIYHVLKPGGFFLFDFALDESDIRNRRQRWFWLGRTFAYITLGNFGYQVGDRFYAGIEFLHYFSEGEIIAEARRSGFEIEGLSAEKGQLGGAVLRRAGGM